ncbi:Gti1/Pac2 family-domain-containing protein [Xylaria cf. heliscus]|nr:Gti1/Pac2 family-domain-containing protein [Xylaria cf. heliscus]
MEALILFECTLSGILSHVPRRPHDRERGQLIQSGNVFIYEEHSSGIKRWTDGVPWSPSRILGNFLLYRELDKPFQPGEKKRAMKRSKTDGVSKQTSNARCSTSAFAPDALASQAMTTVAQNSMDGTDFERAYVGSLVDSYRFKEHGLVKKTISVTHKGVQHHLVSYYSLDDIKGQKLRTVSNSPELQGIRPRESLIHAGGFRSPIDETDLNIMDPRQFMNNSAPIGYSTMTNTIAPSRSLSMPSTQPYVNSQAWSSQSYAYNPGYNVSPPVQQSTSNYGNHLLHAYNYETTYVAPSQPPTFNTAIRPMRRRSLMPTSNGTNQLGYSAPPHMLANGSSLTTNGIPGSPYINGDMFGVSAANAVVEGTSGDANGENNTAGVIDQNNSTNGINTPAPHNTSEFDGRLSGVYEHPMNQLAIGNFRGPLHGPVGSNFGPTSPDTSPTNMTLGLNHNPLPSPEIPENPEELEWNRTLVKNGDQW